MAGDGSITLTTEIDDSGIKSGLSKLESGIKAVGTAFAAVGTAAAAGFAAVTTAAVNSFAEFEQLKGGVETLFKDSANTLMGYADQAYQTAGLSANEYMATVTSFSASLLQSLDGDTATAADYANQAIIDMSDNANKMGTSMEMIQNAYQGFAKQNYTMLDNLKLGYGGTKEEMQRLLDDAEKISGIEFDISSFADVTQAIHIIQTELGITGTTALEASTTIQGSASAMKAAWQNLLTGLADPTQNFEQLLQNFISSLGTFASNLLPVVSTAASGIFKMVQGLLPEVTGLLEEMLPIVVDGVSGIVSGLVQVLPQIVNAIIAVLPQILTALVGLLPQILSAGVQIVTNLAQGIVNGIPQLTAKLPEVINNIAKGITSGASSLISSGKTILTNIISGISGAIGQVHSVATQIVSSLGSTLVSNLPSIISAGTQAITSFVQGISSQISQVSSASSNVSNTFVSTIIGQASAVLNAGVQILTSLVSGILQALPTLVSTASDLITNIVNTISGLLPNVAASGVEILNNIINGITETIPQLLASASNIISTIVSTIAENLPKVLQAGIDILLKVISGLRDSLPKLAAMVPQIIVTVVNTIAENLPKIFSAGTDILKKLIDGIKSIFSNLVSLAGEIIVSLVNSLINNKGQLLEAGKSLMQAVADGLKSLMSAIVTIGKNIVEGLWNGISSAAGWLGGKISGFVTGVLNDAKKALGIQSPSKVFRDEVGKQIPAGMAIGIDKASYLVTEALNALVSDSRSETDKVLDDFYTKSLESEKKYAAESLRIKRENEKKEYQEKLKSAQKQLKKDEENAKKQLDEKIKNAADLTEIAEARIEYEEKITEIHNKYDEDVLRIKNDRIKQQQDEATQNYLESLKEAADAERKIYEARQKDIENSQKKIVDTYEETADEILDSIKDLQSKQNSLAEKLRNYGDVMEDVVTVEDRFSDVHGMFAEINGKFVLRDLASQTEELEKYYRTMRKLRSRKGMDAELFDIVKNMSFEESFQYAKKLMAMSDDLFSIYIEEWQKKQETSKKISVDLFGEDSETFGAGKILSDLTEQTEVLEDYYMLLEAVRDRAEVPEGFFDALRNMEVEEGLEYANALLELSDRDFERYIKAWEEKQELSQLISKELYREEAEQLATEIGDKFEEVEAEFFDVGTDAAERFEKGFLERLEDVITNIKSTIGKAFSSVSTDIVPQYDGAQTYSINVPALAKGSVLPGGSPFLAIVNDQPRGQTNIEAPLQTIVDAMNIALNGRETNEIIREEHYHLDDTELMSVLYRLVKGGERLQGRTVISGGAY